MSESLLTRWARRKQAVRAAERLGAPPEPDAADPALALAPDANPDETPPDPQTALADLPSLEAFTHESDLAPFLRTGIPTALRNAALRRMWSTDPAIRDFVSEAREYAYDWNTPGSVPGLGPLLPSDDVQAMLGRLIGRAEAQDPQDPLEPAPAEAPDPGMGVAATDAEVDTAPPALLAESGPVSLGDAPSPASDAVGMPPEASSGVAKLEESPLRPRLRRHGGAIPT